MAGSTVCLCRRKILKFLPHHSFSYCKTHSWHSDLPRRGKRKCEAISASIVSLPTSSNSTSFLTAYLVEPLRQSGLALRFLRSGRALMGFDCTAKEPQTS